MSIDLMPGFGAFTASGGGGGGLPTFPGASQVTYEAVVTPPIWSSGLRTTGQTDPAAGSEGVLYTYNTESGGQMGTFSGRGLLTNGAAFSYTGGTTYTISVYGKQSGTNGRYLRLALYDTEGGDAGVLFDLQTGAVGNSRASGITETNTGITSVGSGWYQCYFSVTGLVGAIDNIQIGPSNVNSTDFDATLTTTGASSDGIVVWRLQIVSGTDPNG
jgi:hypothetical protein